MPPNLLNSLHLHAAADGTVTRNGAAVLRIRGSIFYSRFSIPTKFKALFRGKQEIWLSLRTACRSTAKLRVTVWEGQLSKLIQSLHTFPSALVNLMSYEQIQRLLQQYKAETLQQWEQSRIQDDIDEDSYEAITGIHTDELEAIEGELTYNKFKRIKPEIEALLSQHQLSIPTDPQEYRLLCREYLKVRQAVLLIELRRMHGGYHSEQSLGRNGQCEEGVQGAGSAPPETISFKNCVAKYFQEQQLAPRTTSQMRSEFEKFIGMVGGDRSLHLITKADCRTYKESLVSRGLGKSTMNKHLSNLRQLIQWAIDQGYYAAENPVEGLRLKASRKDKRTKREPLTDVDIKVLFTSPNYLKQRADKNPERYWIPLLLLYSGARLGEIAQLQFTDIKQDEGIWYLHLIDDPSEGKTLKTSASRRRVPLHSQVMKRGFLSYVESVRTETQAGPLFPKLKDNPKRSKGGAVSTWFTRHRREVGITSTSKVLHSMRHTVNTKLHSVGVEGSLIRAVLGHEGDTVNETTYFHAEAVPLHSLQQVIEKLNYKGLD